MDNQQESSKLIDMAWFAGIIDGEGTLTLVVKYTSNKNRGILITPNISVVNTDELIISNCERILKENDLPFWRTNYKATGNWKERFVLQITGLKRCAKALPVFKDYLIGKRELANKINNWILYRLSTPDKHYSDYDMEIVKQIKAYHGHRLVLKSSETIRGTSV